MGLDRDALDRWITDSRFSEAAVWVRCPMCDEETFVKATTEYGTTEWDPSECSTCKREFTYDESYRDDEPPEPDYHDDPPDNYDPRIDYPERYGDGPY